MEVDCERKGISEYLLAGSNCDVFFCRLRGRVYGDLYNLCALHILLPTEMACHDKDLTNGLKRRVSANADRVWI